MNAEKKDQIIYEANKIKAFAELMINVNPDEAVFTGSSMIVIGSLIFESMKKILNSVQD